MLTQLSDEMYFHLRLSRRYPGRVSVGCSFLSSLSNAKPDKLRDTSERFSMLKLVSFQNRVRLFPSGYGIVGTPKIGRTKSKVGAAAVGSSGVGVGLAVGAEVAVDVGGMGVAEG